MYEYSRANQRQQNCNGWFCCVNSAYLLLLIRINVSLHIIIFISALINLCGNESSSTALHCTACPGPPEAPALVSSIPPNADLSWSPPSASGAWSYTYEVSWTNGSVIVPRQTHTTGQIPGLQAETEYPVEITAYPDSTLCPDQSTTFMFMTTQSKWNFLWLQGMAMLFLIDWFASLKLL